ncbi:MAG: hypothetical protein KGI35_17325, partial [Burkholderiales bacterium]|nr:hypothetical protein [Burkholderiales bacterium]
ADFAAALNWAFDHSMARPARRIVCVDPSFADWPLDAPALHEKLTAWLRLPQRRLVLLARDFEALPRCHPRFVAWRVDWSHAIETRMPQEGEAPELPTLFVDDADLAVQLVDRRHWRGRAELDAGQARLWRDRIDVVLQRSTPAFAPDSLGL